VRACQSATKKKHSYSCCSLTQLLMTPCRCPRCRRPVGRMPDRIRCWESMALKRYSCCARQPGRGAVFEAGDYSGKGRRQGKCRSGKGGRISLANAQDTRYALLQVDHRGGLAAAEAGV